MPRTLLPFLLAPFLLAAAAPTTSPTTPKEWVDWRDAILKTVPPATKPVDRDTAAKTVIASNQAYLSAPNPDARLNTAILFAQLQTLSSDSVLIDMLKNPDPAVRLWAAKGLASIAPSLKVVGPTKALTALKTALAAEKDPTVQSEITKTLAAY